MEQQSNTITTVHELVAYYRELRPEKFSDSKIEYETPLTKELFEKQLETLSTKKMQSNFENFIVRCSERLITLYYEHQQQLHLIQLRQQDK